MMLGLVLHMADFGEAERRESFGICVYLRQAGSRPSCRCVSKRIPGPSPKHIIVVMVHDHHWFLHLQWGTPGSQWSQSCSNLGDGR